MEGLHVLRGIMSREILHTDEEAWNEITKSSYIAVELGKIRKIEDCIIEASMD